MAGWRAALAAGTLGLVATWFAPATAWALSGVPPLAGPVVRGFDPPDQNWLAGHRGVDLLGTPGSPVAAAAAGQVTFSGQIGGQGVVVVSHGDLRTTYEPVTSVVKVGDQVGAGQEIGTLDDGHTCPGGTCLHWGLKEGDTYLDPLSLLDSRQVRLLPASAVELARQAARQRANAISFDGSSPGLLAVPATGPITSVFGNRMHPIDGVVKFHNGVDIGAPCGSPILAAASGTVQSVAFDEGGGNMLVIDNGLLGSQRIQTEYLHAASYQVRVGQQVARGEPVGQVGSTGKSTGCHLHFSVRVDGTYADPQKFW